MKFKLNSSASLIVLQIVLGVGTAEAIEMADDLSNQGVCSRAVALESLENRGADLDGIQQAIQTANTAVTDFSALVPAPTEDQVRAVTHITRNWGAVLLVLNEVNALVDLQAAAPSRNFTQVEVQDYAGAAAIGNITAPQAQHAKLRLAALGLDFMGAAGTLTETVGYLQTGATNAAAAVGGFVIVPEPSPEEINATHVLRHVATTRIDQPTNAQIESALCLKALEVDLTGVTAAHLADLSDYVQSAYPTLCRALSDYRAMVIAHANLTPSSLQEINAYRDMQTRGLALGVNHLDQVKAYLAAKGADMNIQDGFQRDAVCALVRLAFDLRNHTALATATDLITAGVPHEAITEKQIRELTILEDNEERQALLGLVLADNAFDPTAAGNMDLVKAVAQAEDIDATAAAIIGADQIAAAKALMAENVPLSGTAVRLWLSIDDDALKGAVIDVLKKGLGGVVKDKTGCLAVMALQRIGALTPVDAKNIQAAEFLLRTTGLRVGTPLVPLTGANMTADHVAAARWFMEQFPGQGLTNELLHGATWIAAGSSAFSRDTGTIQVAGRLIIADSAIQPTQEQINLFIGESRPVAATGYYTEADVVAALIAFNNAGHAAVHDASASELRIWLNPLSSATFLTAARAGAAGGGAGVVRCTQANTGVLTAVELIAHRNWLVDDVARGTRW